MNRFDYMYIVYMWTNGAINFGTIKYPLVTHCCLTTREDAYTNKFMLGQSVGRQTTSLRQNVDSLSVCLALPWGNQLVDRQQFFLQNADSLSCPSVCPALPQSHTKTIEWPGYEASTTTVQCDINESMTPSITNSSEIYRDIFCITVPPPLLETSRLHFIIVHDHIWPGLYNRPAA